MNFIQENFLLKMLSICQKSVFVSTAIACYISDQSYRYHILCTLSVTHIFESVPLAVINNKPCDTKPNSHLHHMRRHTTTYDVIAVILCNHWRNITHCITLLIYLFTFVYTCRSVQFTVVLFVVVKFNWFRISLFCVCAYAVFVSLH